MGHSGCDLEESSSSNGWCCLFIFRFISSLRASIEIRGKNMARSMCYTRSVHWADRNMYAVLAIFNCINSSLASLALFSEGLFLSE